MVDPKTLVEEQEWYTPEIDRKELKGLMKKDNYHALYMVGLWVLLLGATGYLAFMSLGTAWVIPAFFLYGVLYSACDARWHESSHGTVFRTPWLNDLLHFWSTAMQQRDIVFTHWSHVRHHSYTVINGVDLEITVPRPPKFFPQIINFFNIQQGIHYIRILILHSLGIVSKEAKICVPEEEYKKMFFWARLSMITQIIPIALSLYLGSWLPVLFYGLPRFYGAPLQWMFILQQHAGLEEDVWDHRRNSRTVKVNPFFAFLFMNMQYHIEHHMYPLMPFHALPKLHKKIVSQEPVPYKGMWQVYKEMIPALFRQKKDTSYFIERPLPEASEKASSDRSSENREAVAEGDWIRVCAEGDIDEMDVIPFEYKGESYAVFNLAEKGYYATEGLCTHEQAPLGNGVVEDNCRVACPKHNARFDILSGKALTRPAQTDLKTYPAKAEKGSVFIKI
ncbi:MAG: fatty acid desaturase [Spirochaetales bacterium]|nr:fatty acid desaturase [Spirochaetales bacterium]